MNATGQGKILGFSLLVILVGCSRSSESQDKCRLQIGILESQLDIYRLHLGEYPTTQQGLKALRTPPPDLPNPIKWIGPYSTYGVQSDDIRTQYDSSGIPEDPWGNPYQYELPGPEKCWLWSMGPDGVSGTPDDIRNY